MEPRMALYTAVAVKATVSRGVMMSKRLDPRAQMEDLNTDAVTSLLIKFMSSAYLFHWQMVIIYLAIDEVMNNTVVHK